MHENICESHFNAAVTNRRLRFTLIAIVATLIAISVATTPAVSFDANVGLLTYFSSVKGAPFNHLRLADPANLGQDRDVYWSAHSPGQYLVPVALRWTGLSLGTCLSALYCICLTLGSVGYYYLYTRTFSFTVSVSLLSCIVMLLTRQWLDQLLSYSGGPVLQFAVFPYFVIAALYLYSRRGLWLLVVPALYLLGAFMKLSLAIVALGMTIASLIIGYSQHRRISGALVRGAIESVLFVIFYGILYVVFTSRGFTAAGLPTVYMPSEVIVMCLYSVASCLSGCFSVFWSLARLGSPLHFSQALYHDITLPWITVVAVLAALACVVIYVVFKRVQSNQYRCILLSFAVVHVACLTLFFVRGSLITEDRHAWPVSAILLPGIVKVIVDANKARRLLASGIISVMLCYGITSFGVNFVRLRQSPKSPSVALSFPGVSQSDVTLIEVLDRQLSEGRNVFVFEDPSLGILIRRNSVLFVAPAEIMSRQYRGAPDTLIVIARKSSTSNVSLSQIASVFPDVGDWTVIREDDKLLFCVGGGSAGRLDLSSR